MWPIDAYIRERRLELAERTWRTYREVLRDAERRTGVAFSRIERRHLLALSSSWQHRAQNLSALRGLLRWAGHPLAEHVPRGIPPGSDRQLVWYTLAEIEAIVAACAMPRERLIVHLACELMLRRIEIERLTWADLEPTCIRVLGKGRHGGKVRRVPWHPYTREILRSCLGGSTEPTSSMDTMTHPRGSTGSSSAGPSRRCSTTRDTSGGARSARTSTDTRSTATSAASRTAAVVGLRRSALDKELKRIQESLRWSGVRLNLQFHALRRTGGRLFVDAGIRAGKAPLHVLNELRGIYGHTDLATTMRYIGWDLEEAAATMTFMPNLGEKGKGQGRMGTAGTRAAGLDTQRLATPPRDPG